MLIGLKKYERILLVFTLIDIFFAPYVFFVATAYSQFFVFVWFLFKDKKCFNTREVKAYYGFLFFVVLSVGVSMLVIPVDNIMFYVFDNVKIGLNMGMGISYYFLFYYVFKSFDLRIEKWLFAFVIYVTLWGIIYYVDIDTFVRFKRLFNPRDSFLGFAQDESYFLRFNFIWTDPNNVGYALVSVVCFLIINKGVSELKLALVMLLAIFDLFVVMSTGAIVSAFLFIPIAYFIRLRSSKSTLGYVMVIMSIIIMSLVIYEAYDAISQSEIGEIAIARQVNKSGASDSRTQIWRSLIESKNILYYIFTGEGSVIFVDKKPFAPHNGHLALIYSYGIICYLFYMYIVFRKSHKQKIFDFIYIIPLFLCFSVNVGIGELKFAAIMYMIISYSRVNKIN